MTRFILSLANIPRSLLIIIRDNEIDQKKFLGRSVYLVITRFPIIRRQVQILRSWPITRCSMAITICKVNEGTLRSTRTPNNSSNLHTDIGVIRRKLVTGNRNCLTIAETRFARPTSVLLNASILAVHENHPLNNSTFPLIEPDVFRKNREKPLDGIPILRSSRAHRGRIERQRSHVELKSTVKRLHHHLGRSLGRVGVRID